jgi:hypothetical protein
MNLIRPVAAAVLAALAMATGCLGGAPNADVATVPTTGVIVTVGGPAPGAPAPAPGVKLRLAGAGGSVHVRADAAAAGRDRRPARGRPPGAAGRLDPVTAIT